MKYIIRLMIALLWIFLISFFVGAYFNEPRIPLFTLLVYLLSALIYWSWRGWTTNWDEKEDEDDGKRKETYY